MVCKREEIPEKNIKKIFRSLLKAFKFRSLLHCPPAQKARIIIRGLDHQGRYYHMAVLRCDMIAMVIAGILLAFFESGTGFDILDEKFKTGSLSIKKPCHFGVDSHQDQVSILHLSSDP